MPLRGVLLFLVAPCLAACNYPAGDAVPGFAAGSPPSTWIDRPLEGSVVALGEAVPIRWHATDLGGIHQVEIRINGVTFQVIGGLDPQSQLVTEETIWDPAEPGEYLIEVIATNLNGMAGPAADKRITVTTQATPTETMAASPTPTTTPTPSATPSPTSLPPTRTPTPAPDTQAPPRPSIVAPEGAIDCTPTVILDWNPVTDPSGISGYRVVLKVSYDNGATWNTLQTWDPATATNVDASAYTDCGGLYGWTVAARDGAGNLGPADAALFGIGLP